jgi:hypothetical protein
MAPRLPRPTFRSTQTRRHEMRRVFEIGGLIAGVVLIALGVAAIFMA